MAAAAYTTDLQTYNDATSVTNWAELTGMAVTDGNGNADTDLAILGTICISESQRKSGLGSIAYTGTEPTWTSGWGYFIWNKFFAPNSLGTLAQGGIRVAIGDTVANYYGWYMDGSDTYPYGGWINYVVDPETNAGATQTQGTPSGVWNTVGIGYNLPVNGISKGNSATVDIIRYGRGESRITDGDLGNGYATFNGLALVNDNATTGRWGLFQDQGGSYLFKGLMSLGLAGTSVDFRDSNIVINIDDTIAVTSDFNRIEVHNTGSNIEWDSVNITSLGTTSKGNFEMIDNCPVSLTTCVFTDMGTFSFLTGATGTTTSFIRCDQIIPSGATFTLCDFVESINASAILTRDLDKIESCNFIGDGTGHAVELTDLGIGSMTWDNTFDTTTYATINGSTGNETIYVNVATGTLTINVPAGATTPTIRTAGAVVTVVVNPVTIQITVKDVSTGVAISGARVKVEVANGDNFPYQDSVTISSSLNVASVAHTTHGLSDGDFVTIKGAVETPYLGCYAISGVTTNAYDYTLTESTTSPATGTITATFAYFNTLTNGSGIVTDTRALGVDQLITGKVRKSTTPPLYKTQPISETISSTAGLTLNVSLISDE
tara:strand:+ start:20506 stop:22317 length:1812 start_codon:yes stop_codon:yes gene_type:complete